MWRLEIHTWLDEHEAALVPLLFLQTKHFLAAGLELLGAGLKQVKRGTELQPGNDEHVHYHRQQHTIPPREGAADDGLILVPILEVEMYQ